MKRVISILHLLVKARTFLHARLEVLMVDLADMGGFVGHGLLDETIRTVYCAGN